MKSLLILSLTFNLWLSSFGGPLPSCSVISAAPPNNDEIEQTTIFDETEPNNARNRANQVPAGISYVRGAITPANDVDFFSFTANAGDYVFAWVDTTPSTTSRDSTLRLMFNNQTIATDDNNGPNPEASGVSAVRLARAGTYAVEVKAGGNATINAYRLFLCVLPNAIKNETEPNNVFDQATPAGNISRGVISVAGDMDVWAFPATEKDTLAIGLNQTGQSMPFDAVVELRDPSGMLLINQNNNGAGQGASEFLHVLSLPATGLYTVSVLDARMNMGSDQYDYLMSLFLNGRPLRRAPMADAGPDIGVFEGENVMLDGSESRGANGEMLEYEWTLVEGRQVQATGQATPFYSFMAPMEPIATLTLREFELKVTTPFGLSATDRVSVRVSDRFVLKDDMTVNRVLLNLAAEEFTWTGPSGASITRAMKVITADERLVDLVGDEGVDFAGGASLDSKEGKASFKTGNLQLSVYDSNFEDSQGLF